MHRGGESKTIQVILHFFLHFSALVQLLKKVMKKLEVAYNNAFRILMKYPRDCSASGMFAKHSLPSGQAILRNLSFKFMRRIDASENRLVKAINLSDSQWRSNIRRHWLNSIYCNMTCKLLSTPLSLNINDSFLLCLFCVCMYVCL